LPSSGRAAAIGPAALGALQGAVERSHDVGDRPALATSLERAIPTLLALAELEPAWILAGLIAGPLRELSVVSHPDLDDTHDALMAARPELGPDRFEALLARGKSMTCNQAVTYAVEEINQLPASADK
jgi:hypothetical protein